MELWSASRPVCSVTGSHWIRMCEPQSRSEHPGGNKKIYLLPQPGIEPWFLGCKCHRYCSIRASHAQDDTLCVIFHFTSFTWQRWNNFHTDIPTVYVYIYTLTKELGICRQRRCLKTHQASINDNPSVTLRHIYRCTRTRAITVIHTKTRLPKTNTSWNQAQFHSFQEEIMLCRVL